MDLCIAIVTPTSQSSLPLGVRAAPRGPLGDSGNAEQLLPIATDPPSLSPPRQNGGGTCGHAAALKGRMRTTVGHDASSDCHCVGRKRTTGILAIWRVVVKCSLR